MKVGKGFWKYKEGENLRRIEELEDTLLKKNVAVFQLDAIRYKALSKDEYDVIRSALEELGFQVQMYLSELRSRV